MKTGTRTEPIINSGSDQDYVKWEYAYITQQIGPYNRERQALLNMNGKFIDEITVRDEDGKIHTFYFDNSGPMNRMMNKLKDTYEGMKDIF